jgi:hypothetical protein
MIEKERIKGALLLYGLEDMLDLGWMAQSVRLVAGKERQDPQVVDLTLEAIHGLLEGGYAVVGDGVQDERGFASVDHWDRSPDAAIAEIKSRWSTLKEPLRPVGVVWVELTEKGREEAKRLDETGLDPFKDVSA